MSYYAIQATVSERVQGVDTYHRARQVPTFYLHENVQGILSEEHAAKIARDIIDPFGKLQVNVTAVKL